MSDPKNSLQKTSLEDQLSDTLTEIKSQTEEKNAKRLADQLGLPYINLTTIPIDTEALFIVPEKEARTGELAILQNVENILKVAVVDPARLATKTALENLTKRGFHFNLFIASHRSLIKAFERYQDFAQEVAELQGQFIIADAVAATIKAEIKIIEDIPKKIASTPSNTATNLLEVIIVSSIQVDASDIHLETKENAALFRFRIDGILHDIVSLSSKAYGLIITRLKLISGMTLNLRDIAQDGRFTIKLEKKEIEVRVSVLPGPNGENVVMRILHPKNINLNIKDLGFRDDAHAFITKEIERPNGMIITTGPTGSGKTTALYAFLKEVTDPEIKIITLEDPIEYHLAGVTQTQVEADRGYTFAAGLRAILRQDPDIILVGEIRDKETAEIAIQSALTGHIVFSTLHTNDAAGAIPRFIDMGANPVSLSAALIDIMAQRLLRRVCSACKEEYASSPEELEKIKKALANLPKTVAIPEITSSLKLARGKGCPLCNQTGYKGRVGIYEIIHVDSELEKLITKSPSHAEILDILTKKDFVSMYQDGMLKAVQQVTTIAELESIVGAAS